MKRPLSCFNQKDKYHVDYEGLKSQRVMGDGWSDTQGCDKQKKEDDKLYAQLKESFFINLIILLQVKRGF